MAEKSKSIFFVNRTDRGISKKSKKRTLQVFLKSLKQGLKLIELDPNEDVLTLCEFIALQYKIPIMLQRLRYGRRDLEIGKKISVYHINKDSIISILLRISGGKGGFGALLRGQGRDIKATTNFDACRDLSGRRMRHVNAEKKLSEWAKESQERELEAIALSHIKERTRQEKRDKRDEVDIGAIKQKQADAVERVKTAISEVLKEKCVLEAIAVSVKRQRGGRGDREKVKVKKARFAHFESDEESSSEGEKEV